MKMNDEYMLDEKVSKKSRAISLSMAEEKQKNGMLSVRVFAYYLSK
jgi:hypothetical protein